MRRRRIAKKQSLRRKIKKRSDHGYSDITILYLRRHKIPEEAHKITLNDFLYKMKYKTVEHKKDTLCRVLHDLISIHMKLIMKAVRQGRKIPAIVLHDYPTIWQRYIQYD